ncbi:glycerol-3-phosphate dehydrogenase [Oceanisphaera litoralis]|uniref:glycerol-3-phosphate dehydrogenase n=1 Tax=Oceanisphaera litoralis TaxID=225144 RepID=UPI0019568A0F|nr:glycerol-3-phosphate dehydrogenase [Oceanisphaera litoralis]MBM7454752.1 glycerol-3-phosphate dehydrogenase [Oceanisphaera litoralis]
MTTDSPLFDVLVIGGGVNGTGIAMDAAGRGLRVMLCEMSDLASATSSNSSKLIHGGLRYLEHYEFALVKKALAERELLLKSAPHIMWPLRFRLPHRPHLRPAWMIRAGLFLYDHLARRKHLPGSCAIRFGANSPLQPQITRGFEYSDGWVDDARLVVLCAMAAFDRGAEIKTRTRCIRARRKGGLWQLTLQNTVTGERKQYRSRALVNAAGPWASSLFADTMTMPAPRQLRLVKGSHILVPRLHDGPEAYILQNEDQRIVFVLPYQGRFSLIGTTDVDYEGDPAEVAIDDDEVKYLCHLVNGYFKRQTSPADLVWRYSGVRPLIDDAGGDAQAASRDYRFELNAPENEPPLLSVFGGKLTTYRLLAEAATGTLCRFFPEAGPPWTHTAVLPGGNFSTPARLAEALRWHYPWLPDALLQRFVRSYGTLCHRFLQGCERLDCLGEAFGGHLYQKEVDYLVEYEWATTVEDILWRRTKLGLELQDDERDRLQQYLQARGS